tara:strand:- start:776 stop:2494 length:1719 start_codon:yes stop_codon:yes gene_type:complete
MANTETLNLEINSDIKSVTKDADDLTTSLGKSVDETKDLGGNLKDAGDKGSKGFGKMGTAIKGMGTALKAAGIGLVVGLIAKLMEVFSKNQPVVDAFDTAMTALSIAFNDLFKFLSNNVGKVTGWFKEIFEDPKQTLIDFGDAIQKNLIERFHSFLDTMGFVGEALGLLLKGKLSEAADAIQNAGKEAVDVFTGVDNTVDKAKATIKSTTEAITKYTKETTKAAAAVVKLSKASLKAAAINQGIIEQKDREAELQRQIRDDESKTFAERIEANTELATILEEQKVAMEANADIMIAHAAAQVKINANDANKVALIEAQNEKAAIAAQITGLASEQKVNQVALEKELLETQKELHLASLEGTELELQELADAYELKLEMARKAGEDTLAIEDQYYNDVVAIAERSINEIQTAQKAADDKELARTKAVNDAKVNMANNALGAMAVLAGENEAAGKAIAVAQTIFATQQAIMSALAGGGTDIALPYWVKLGNAISAGIMGAASIKTILSTSSATAGSGGGGGGGGSSAPPSPQMMSGSFDLGAGQEVEPTQAYVVSDDITESQNGLALIRRRATI